MAQLKVRIEPADDAVDDGAPFAGSVVHVVLRDTSEADALHPLVAETTGTVEDGLGGKLVLDLADDALSERRRYSLFAHVDRTGDGSIHPGDLITTEDIQVAAADVGHDATPIRVPVRRI